MFYDETKFKEIWYFKCWYYIFSLNLIKIKQVLLDTFLELQLGWNKGSARTKGEFFSRTDNRFEATKFRPPFSHVDPTATSGEFKLARLVANNTCEVFIFRTPRRVEANTTTTNPYRLSRRLLCHYQWHLVLLETKNIEPVIPCLRLVSRASEQWNVGTIEGPRVNYTKPPHWSHPTSKHKHHFSEADSNVRIRDSVLEVGAIDMGEFFLSASILWHRVRQHIHVRVEMLRVRPHVHTHIRQASRMTSPLYETNQNFRNIDDRKITFRPQIEKV